MEFKLRCHFTFSEDITGIQDDIKKIICTIDETVLKKSVTTGKASIESCKVTNNLLILDIFSKGTYRVHNALLQIRNTLSKEVGQKHHVGVREIKIKQYSITFDLEREALKPVSIPFADVMIKGKQATILLREVTEEFLRRNYIDRIINLVREKIANQYYEGKAEFWKLIWQSKAKEPIWSSNPTEEMIRLGWVKQGPTKGKWFFRTQITAIMRAMETIAVDAVLKPLGFNEIIESHMVPFDIWLKTGHLEGMPGEFYYIVEPASRDVEQWQRFIDLTKITKEVAIDELNKNLSSPNAGVCYAQCPVIYWSFKGKTLAEQTLPVLVFDRAANSNRYESGGRHGIERVDEFHRIEPVYIGTREQLLELREKLINRYKHVFNNILDLEWRMAWVTPWYIQQAGKIKKGDDQECGTIDFEAYMPYRGERKTSEWLEFQNLSILGDKYVKAFNIKAQKSNLWSGCSGIGLERWSAVFLAQKGLEPKNWPSGFKEYLKEPPKGIEFL